MAALRTFLRSGHAPTLYAAFVYFTYCCGVWVSDHWGGINTLTTVLVVIAVTLALCGLVPNVMGLSKQYTGTYMWGFLLFAALTVCVLGMMRSLQIRWTRTWAEKGGRARSA